MTWQVEITVLNKSDHRGRVIATRIGDSTSDIRVYVEDGIVSDVPADNIPLFRRIVDRYQSDISANNWADAIESDVEVLGASWLESNESI